MGLTVYSALFQYFEFRQLLNGIKIYFVLPPPITIEYICQKYFTPGGTKFAFSQDTLT